jgi:cellulose synthase operon protein YhjQ
MSAICFCSPKGGVGKTSLAANVAGMLARSGARILVVDLDVQNALRLHFGVPLTDGRGWASCLVNRRSLREGLQAARNNILVMPFGQVSPTELKQVSTYLEGNRAWMANALAPFVDRGYVIVFDTSPGPSVFLEQTRPLSTLDVVVLQADATSVSLLPTLEQRGFPGADDGGRRAAIGYAFNLVDVRRRLTRDLVQMIHRKLGSAVLGVVNYDDNFGESIAHQQLAVDRAPASKAAHDVQQLAARIQALIPALQDTRRKTG